MHYPGKGTHPLFLASVFVLIVNDWILKSALHNTLTGKLSDFAGLFAFPYLFAVLFPRYAGTIHISTGILFIYWKSTLSQPLIDFINEIGVPVSRVVDPTDFIALISILASYFVFKRAHRQQATNTSSSLRPVMSFGVILISCFAFMATTMPPGQMKQFADINKEYSFDFSKRELVDRLNMLLMKEMTSVYNPIDFHRETGTFHYRGSKDTVAMMIDFDKLHETDTIKSRAWYVDFAISGDTAHSSLKLLSIYGYVRISAPNRDYRKGSIRQFERRIVKKIK